MRFVFLILVVAFSTKAFAEEESGQKDRIGPGKAVTAANVEQGMKLSEKALKGLRLDFLPMTTSEITLSKNALISFQDFLAVYRLRDGWIRLVEVEPRIRGNYATISSKDLQPGDQIVVRNGGLLRVVELDIFGPEADACAD